jgi:hypothetical protein
MQHHPNRQILKGLGRKKGTLGKDKRYSYNKVKRLLYMKKEEVSIDNKNEGSINKGNNVRYLRIYWIDIMTECQVQLRIIYY